ncbi:MAG: hypothetical protein QME35_10165 [Thermoanaerobacteraceae bacterium]|nr:hypothetical protein [Thermoanaerobacteraceae bacterium]
MELKESEGEYSVDKSEDLLLKAIKELPTAFNVFYDFLHYLVI